MMKYHVFHLGQSIFVDFDQIILLFYSYIPYTVFLTMYHELFN